MSNKNQTTDSRQGSIGTAVKSLSTRDSSGTPPLGNGKSGEKAMPGNRNKRS